MSKVETISAVVDLLDATLAKDVPASVADKMVVVAIRLLRAEYNQLTGN